MSDRGRIPKLTPELHKLIVADVEAGCAGEIAAMANGIHRSTFYLWMANGRKAQDGAAKDFYDDVTRARAAAEVKAVKAITTGMLDDPKLAVEYLRRARWKRWEPKTRMEMKLQPVSELSDDELAAELKTALNVLAVAGNHEGKAS